MINIWTEASSPVDCIDDGGSNMDILDKSWYVSNSSWHKQFLMTYMTLSYGGLLCSVFWNLALSPGRGLRVGQSKGFSAGLPRALLVTVEEAKVARYLTGRSCM